MEVIASGDGQYAGTECNLSKVSRHGSLPLRERDSMPGAPLHAPHATLE
jgi:hypothetical protein